MIRPTSAFALGLTLLTSTLPASCQESGPIRAGDPWHFFRGTQEPAPAGADWRVAAFNDASWETGPTGIGYGDTDDATTLGEMPGRYTSIYLRKRFTIADPAAVRWITLRLDYEDGACLYLNGAEVLRLNLPGNPGTPLPFNARALSWHNAGNAEEFDLTPFRHLLVPGENILAIQVHDDPSALTGVSLVPELLVNFSRGPFIQNTGPTHTEVVWRTPVPSTSTVEFGLTPALGRQQTDPAPTTRHALRLTELSPDTLYYYRVRSTADPDTAISDLRSFRTLKASGPIRFALTADTGSGWRSQLNIARVLRDLAPDLVLHAGDVVYPSFTPGLADTHCLSIYQRHMETTPFFFAFGNHDIYSGDAAFLDTFHLPTNNVTGTEHYYSFDHGDVHFVVLYQPMLNQYLLAPGNVQYNWLVADLAASTKPWKLIALHLPLLTSAHHRFDNANGNGLYDTDELRSILLPIAQQFGVQLIMSGHAHVYERFAPVDGVHTLVSGAGGGTLYPFIERDAASAQFASRYHAVLVTIQGDQLRYEAFDEQGQRFDQATLRRAPAAPRTYQAAWHTPPPAPPATPADGNLPGETFALAGEPIPSMPGAFSNPGLLRVDQDRTHLHLGLEQVMIYASHDVFLFLEVPGLPGVTDLAGLGNGIPDPSGQGVDALDFLENLSFTNFTPAIACVLGDEFADGPNRRWSRPAAALAGGQGVFRLSPGFPTLPGTTLRQFNRSPEGNGEPDEQNADFILASLPLAELGPLQPGQLIRVGLVVGLGQTDTNSHAQARALDRSFIGTTLVGSGLGPVTLEGLPVQLPPDPDPDGDGLDSAWELQAGLDPHNPDTDNDGLLDGWEVRHHLDPRSAPGAGEGNLDPDGDQLANHHEQVFGGDPHDPRSGLTLQGQILPSGAVRLSWPALPGWRFHLQASDRPQGPFSDLPGGDFPRAATGALESFDLAPSDLETTPSRYFLLQFLP